MDSTTVLEGLIVWDLNIWQIVENRIGPTGNENVEGSEPLLVLGKEKRRMSETQQVRSYTKKKERCNVKKKAELGILR